jgi:hypothetical protein
MWRGAAPTYLLWGFLLKKYGTHLSVINFSFFFYFIPQIPSTTYPYLRRSLPTPAAGAPPLPSLPTPTLSHPTPVTGAPPLLTPATCAPPSTNSAIGAAPPHSEARAAGSSVQAQPVHHGRAPAWGRAARARHLRPGEGVGELRPAMEGAGMGGLGQASTGRLQQGRVRRRQATRCARLRRPPHLLHAPPPLASPARAAAARLICYARRRRRLPHLLCVFGGRGAQRPLLFEEGGGDPAGGRPRTVPTVRDGRSYRE